jgi:Apea-like HEPN
MPRAEVGASPRRGMCEPSSRKVPAPPAFGLRHTRGMKRPDIEDSGSDLLEEPDVRDRVVDKAVTVEARRFLTRALAESRRLGIIPNVRRPNRWQRFDGPWPPHYAWYDIADREAMAAGFIAALREAYPARFGAESKFPYKDPEQYVRAYLSAVIAEGVIREGRVAVRSRAATTMLHELHRSVTQDGQLFGVLWLIGDVDFDAVDNMRVGDATLLRPTRPPELLVSRLLPGALWAHDHGYPMRGAKHTGLMWASGKGDGHHWDVTTPINNGMGRLMHAIRLATGATTIERMVWLGEPSMIHVESQSAWPQVEQSWDSWLRRVGTITPDLLPGLHRLTSMIDSLEAPSEARRKKGALSAIVIAIRRYSRSHRTQLWQDAVLELATSLEACLGPRNRDQEIGLTLRTRATHLLAHDDSEQAETIYRDLTDLYNLRSDIIHGNPEWTKTPEKLWSERGYMHLFERDRMHALLDRWRDIVRRTITARLMLGDATLGAGALWPLVGEEPPVDRYLARRDRRDEWRARIMDGAAAYGLPLLVDGAPPLVDYLHNDPAG